MCYGPEFAGRLLDQWAHLNGVEIDFSRPGTPTDNPHIEAFNGRLRAECLNACWFLSLADARDRLEEWRRNYNEERPHGSLGNLTPRAFADQAQPARKVAWPPDQSWGQAQTNVELTSTPDHPMGADQVRAHPAVAGRGHGRSEPGTFWQPSRIKPTERVGAAVGRGSDG
jgi:putative transposase